ncbi:MAG: flavodoxin [Bacteroidota bacterium]
MKQVGVFYGSSTGNCEIVAMNIKQCFNGRADIFDIALTEPEKINEYSNLIFGVSTWGIGDLQADWEEYIEHLKSIDFTGRIIALYGLGDQDTYADSFADGLGKLYSFLIEKNATIVGFWPADEYDFENSSAYANGKFVGLVIDEDIQPELTEPRVKKWVDMIMPEFL